MITADDWGISKPVNQAILHLAQENKISHVSLLARPAFTATGLTELRQTKIQYGFHFFLSDFSFFTPAVGIFLPAGQSAPALLKKLALRFFRLSPAEKSFIQNEFRAQLDFLRRLGISPTRLEGHAHVHVWPGFSRVIQKLGFENQILDYRYPFDRHARGARFWLLNFFTRLSPYQKNTHAFVAEPRALFKTTNLRPALAAPVEWMIHPAAAVETADSKISEAQAHERVNQYRALLEMVVT